MQTTTRGTNSAVIESAASGRTPTFQVHHYQRDVGRRDAADPAGLGEIGRAHSRELLAGLGPQLVEPAVVEARRDPLFRQAASGGRLPSAGGRRSRRISRRTAPGSPRRARRSPAPATGRLHRPTRFRDGADTLPSCTPSTQVASSSARTDSICASFSCSRDQRSASTRPRSCASGVSRRSALSCRSSSAILGPAGEHAIGLVDAARHQVVDQHADVGRVAIEHQRLAVQERERRVGAGDQPLGGRFFVAGRAVDLPGEVQPARPISFRASAASWSGGA